MAPMKLHSRVMVVPVISEAARKQTNKSSVPRSTEEREKKKRLHSALCDRLMLFVFLLHHNANARLETVGVAFQKARTSTEFYAQWRSRRREDDVWPSASSSIRSVRTVNGTGTWVCLASIATESAMECTAHTDGSETHHLPVTLSGVAWVRRQGQGQHCAEDNTKAVSIQQPPWRHGWGSPRQVAVYGMQAHQRARHR
ncbi:hypothetical protein M431DRAFT_552463 [Trichoderma harzianum CBS 226.95]|uniref:Uncharacterized protein n=1 Tax=Trichoderma harzianum CBS 226.95 TaxID=983964 RepID=A0A2T4AF82_TRIHA|nr:hypothetical protein M431DRAFT_552463 [Trichoderma harzianum CBS 226.95]PTB55716.1 hypothetical protein M431DRAFT_552463 [Trichoderma harzianum CBS 226.95]